MNISVFLSPSDVMIGVVASDKRALLQELSQRAASALNVPVEKTISAKTLIKH